MMANAAQDNAATSMAPDKWQFTVLLYGFVPQISGRVSYPIAGTGGNFSGTIARAATEPPMTIAVSLSESRRALRIALSACRRRFIRSNAAMTGGLFLPW